MSLVSKNGIKSFCGKLPPVILINASVGATIGRPPEIIDKP